MIFISHEHKDHSAAYDDLLKTRVPIITGFTNQEFKLALKTSRFIAIQFPVLHGKCNNNGLILQTKNELTLYATDFNICEYDLSKYKFTRIIVECNYIEEKIEQDYFLEYAKVRYGEYFGTPKKEITSLTKWHGICKST